MQFAGPGAELYAAVQQSLQGTPYVMTPTDRGFDVTVNVPHQQVQGLLHQRQVQSVMRHKVAVHEAARKVVVTDEVYRLEWRAGVAYVGAMVSKSSGRQIQITFGANAGADGGQTSFYFNSEEGRRLITDPAKALGWKIGLGAQAKIGLVAALIGGVGALVAIIAVLIVNVM